MKKKKTKSNDLVEILKILKKKGIKSFDRRIPISLLRMLYNFLWDIIYQAKLFSKHAKKKKVEMEDINRICRQISLEIYSQKSLSTKIHSLGNVINSEPLPKSNFGAFLELNYNFSDQFYKENLRLMQDPGRKRKIDRKKNFEKF